VLEEGYSVARESEETIGLSLEGVRYDQAGEDGENRSDAKQGTS